MDALKIAFEIIKYILLIIVGLGSAIIATEMDTCD